MKSLANRNTGNKNTITKYRYFMNDLTNTIQLETTEQRICKLEGKYEQNIQTWQRVKGLGNINEKS